MLGLEQKFAIEPDVVRQFGERANLSITRCCRRIRGLRFCDCVIPWARAHGYTLSRHTPL